jgi:hypothetical protein
VKSCDVFITFIQRQSTFMSERDKLITRSMDGTGHGGLHGHGLTCVSMTEYGAVDIYRVAKCKIKMNESLFCVCFYFVCVFGACMHAWSFITPLCLSVSVSLSFSDCLSTLLINLLLPARTHPTLSFMVTIKFEGWRRILEFTRWE